MTEVDSGVPGAAPVGAAPWADATLIFEPLSDDAGRLTDLRCTSLDEGAQRLLSELDGPLMLRGRGGEGPLDLEACASVLRTGRGRERELVVGRSRPLRRFLANLCLRGQGLALRLREVAADRGTRRLALQQRRSAWRLAPVVEPESSEPPPQTGEDASPDSHARRDPPEPAIWEWFPQLREGAWSHGADRLLGLVRDEVDPSPELLYSCVDPRDREAVSEAIERALVHGGGFTLRYRRGGLATSGVSLSLAGRVEPHEGRGTRLVAVLNVLSEEQSPPEATQRELILREVAREVVWEWNLESDEMRWGETLRSVLGWDQADARDEAWWKQCIHPDDRARVVESLERAIADHGLLWVEEYRFARGDGSHMPVRDRGYLVRDRGGRLIQMVGCVTDLTDAQAEEETRRQEANFRERFIGILGHDLRTPLNAISLSAQTLRRRTPLTEAQREVVGRIQSSTARMERMITEILDLTRARLAGGIPVRPASCDVHALSRRVLKEIQAVHPERAFSFDVQGPGGAMVDAERLEQAVGNLISNAVQHSPTGLPVEIASHIAAGSWQLRVHNWGAPIAPERLTEIFHPFRAGSAHPSKRLGPGLGLGLFIVREIAQAHGGHVTVESTAEEGTRFVLTLPIQSNAKGGRESTRAAPEARQSKAPEEEDPPSGDWAQ